MLRLSADIINQPVMSLRIGGPIATTVAPIINPNNLKIEGFYCVDNITREQLVLLYQDIREFMKQGIAVNDHDALVPPEELVRLKDILELNFDLLGKPVITVNKARLGKVNDYATETTTMYVQKLYVGQPLLKSLVGGTLSVERTEIIEITNRKIVINEPLRPTRVTVAATAQIAS